MERSEAPRPERPHTLALEPAFDSKEPVYMYVRSLYVVVAFVVRFRHCAALNMASPTGDPELDELLAEQARWAAGDSAPAATSVRATRRQPASSLSGGGGASAEALTHALRESALEAPAAGPRADARG